MTNITVYDVDYERMERIADKYGILISDVIEMMLDNIDEDEEPYIFK